MRNYKRGEFDMNGKMSQQKVSKWMMASQLQAKSTVLANTRKAG